VSDRFVVIGSNCFSAAHFVDHLLDKGHEVIGMSRSHEPPATFAVYKKNPKIQNFKFVQADLNKNLGEIVSVINEVKPVYVVNFAAQSMVAESWLYPEHWFETNVVANVKLHDQLRKMPFLKKYVHISTPEVYGSCEGDIDESKAFNPSTPYAVSRAAADMSLMSFFKNYNFPVAFTRAANVFGPGQQLYRIVPRTIMCIKSGEKLKLHGGGKSVRSFIHIKDVADATYRACHSGVVGNAYHLSTREQVSIREVVSMLCELLDKPFESVVDVVEDRPGKDAAYLLDSGKALKHLGWQPTINLAQGLKSTIDWIDADYQELLSLPQDYIHKP